MKNKKLIFIACSFIFTVGISFPQNFFDISTGFRLDPRFYNYEENKQGFELGTSAFFSSSVNLTENFMLRAEMSFELYNIATKDIFTGQGALFWLDDVSFIYKKRFTNCTNYLSLFIGLNEPIGSDTFLERQFGVSDISSKITDGWLGMRDSAIFSPYGFGVSDTIRFGEKPMAINFNLMFTREEANNIFAMNANLRYAMAYRFFTLDASVGVGLPIQADEIMNIKPFDRIYIHSAVTMLIGNDYTPSLLIQSGITNYSAIFAPDAPKNDFMSDSFYLILEPRVRIGKGNLRLSMFSLPTNNNINFYTNIMTEKANYGVFVRDSFGFNFHFSHDSAYIAGKRFTFGGNLTVSFPDKNFIDICKNGIKLDNGITCTLSPYMETELLGGEFRVMLQVEPMKIEGSGQWKATIEANRPEKMFRLNIGYNIRL